MLSHNMLTCWLVDLYNWTERGQQAETALYNGVSR